MYDVGLGGIYVLEKTVKKTPNFIRWYSRFIEIDKNKNVLFFDKFSVY